MVSAGSVCAFISHINSIHLSFLMNYYYYYYYLLITKGPTATYNVMLLLCYCSIMLCVISFTVSFRAVISAILAFLSCWHSSAFYCLLLCVSVLINKKISPSVKIDSGCSNCQQITRAGCLCRKHSDARLSFCCRIFGRDVTSCSCRSRRFILRVAGKLQKQLHAQRDKCVKVNILRKKRDLYIKTTCIEQIMPEFRLP